MNLTKIFFGVALMSFCCISLSYSLKCYVCNNKDTCEKAQKLECNQSLANATRDYLRNYHIGVNKNAISKTYECISEYMSNNLPGYLDIYYKGCVYDGTKSCTLRINSDYGLQFRECSLCKKNGCNPADRASVEVMTVLTTIIIAAILRYVWH